VVTTVVKTSGADLFAQTVSRRDSIHGMCCGACDAEIGSSRLDEQAGTWQQCSDIAGVEQQELCHPL
jgi:hypothetical protein